MDELAVFPPIFLRLTQMDGNLSLQAFAFSLVKAGSTISDQAVKFSVTVFKDEYPESWDDFGLQPIRAVDVPFHNVWGRSFKDGDRKMNPKAATSMQFHILADAEQELTLLKSSGSAGIYIAPKEDNKPKKGYQVIRLGPEKQSQIQSARLDTQCGLVRRRNSFGVRVTSISFDEAFSKLCPDKVPPDRESANHQILSLAPLTLICTLYRCSVPADCCTSRKVPVTHVVVVGSADAHRQVGEAVPSRYRQPKE